MSYLHGSSLLFGDATHPGIPLTKELKEHIPTILRACRDYGLDFYPTIVMLLNWDEISEIAAYSGMPVRYPHWKFGEEYEELQTGYIYGMHKIYEMVINCCGLATNILTINGKKLAGDIVCGDMVLGPTGWRKVTHVVRQPKSEVYNLKFEEFGTITSCTPNHKWLCIRDGNKVWVEAKNMQLGEAVLAGGRYNDYLNRPAQSYWSPEKVLNETRPNIRHRLLPILPPKQMTCELAELMGILSGDGSVGVRLASQLLTVSVHKPQVEFQSHIVDLFTKVFGREPTLYIKKRSVNLISFASKYAVDYMNSMGLSTGCTYKNKRVPSSIWQSSNEFRAAYIRGLFDTDGHCSKSLSMNCFNDELANDVQLLLLEMGIRSKVFRVKNKNNDIAVLTIKGKSNHIKFSKYIGFSLKYKQDALNILIARDGRSGRGQSLPGLMDRIFSRIDEMKKPPEWIYKYRRRTRTKLATSNALYGFLRRTVEAGFEENFGDLLSIAEQPVYILTGKEKSYEETVDIALDHQDHDFLANGLISHNSNPCLIYCLNSNPLADHLTVVAHATGHNDFFKNNIYFSGTDTNMVNKMANHGMRIRKYMSRWGKERVTEFIDHVLRIETLIDPAKAWTDREYKERVIKDSRKYRQPRRLKVDRNYMYPFINTKEFRNKENKRTREKDIADEIGLFEEPTKDILGFIRDFAPLKPWQADIVAMLHDESMYFAPQRQTKVGNEGWASYIDSEIMARQGFISLGQPTHDSGIIEYAAHKMGVLGGKYSMNPYKLGYYLLLDIEKRWNKGQFGPEWDECNDMRIKEKWDTNAGLGKEKVFEVRKFYNDVGLIHEFFTEDFCLEQEYFHWKHYPNGEYKIESRDYKTIKKGLIQRHLNGGLPDIKLTEPNYKGKGYLFLQHESDGRDIYESYMMEVMTSLYVLWGRDIFLATKSEGEERIYHAFGPHAEDIELHNRSEHLKEI